MLKDDGFQARIPKPRTQPNGFLSLATPSHVLSLIASISLNLLLLHLKSGKISYKSNYLKTQCDPNSIHPLEPTLKANAYLKQKKRSKRVQTGPTSPPIITKHHRWDSNWSSSYFHLIFWCIHACAPKERSHRLTRKYFIVCWLSQNISAVVRPSLICLVNSLFPARVPYSLLTGWYPLIEFFFLVEETVRYKSGINAWAQA